MTYHLDDHVVTTIKFHSNLGVTDSNDLSKAYKILGLHDCCMFGYSNVRTHRLLYVYTTLVRSQLTYIYCTDIWSLTSWWTFTFLRLCKTSHQVDLGGLHFRLQD